ncbi:MAG TPA: rhomboid family intramembrane serine protease [Myxococcota bacterium]
MLPLRDDVPSRSAPLVVETLVLLNLAAFLYALTLDPGDTATFFDRWGLVPREFLRGVAHPTATQQVAWLTPLSAMFLHGSLLHLAGNPLYLWVFGAPVEDLLGHARFALFYLACGIVAAAAHLASAPGSYVPTLGASGAISGLLGAYAIAYPTGRLRLLWPRVRVPAFLFLGLWIALQIFYGVRAAKAGAAEIAWWAHVGGFLAGATLARSMWVRKPTRSRLRS